MNSIQPFVASPETFGACLSHQKTESSRVHIFTIHGAPHKIQKNEKMVKCCCSLSNESGSGVSGVLRLSQVSEDGPTTIEGEIKGLSSGKHGITVNTFGDLSEGAASCGEIFNPFGT